MLILINRIILQRCDIFSLAILTYEILTYTLPYLNMTPVSAGISVAKNRQLELQPHEYVYLRSHSCVHLYGQYTAAESRCGDGLSPNPLGAPSPPSP